MFSHLGVFDNPYQEERTQDRAAMNLTDSRSMTYQERLNTFRGYWDEHEVAARQLAALGHICDRPPLEAIEEGSHCICCDIFVRKDDSIRALEGPLCKCTSNGDNMPTIPNLHHPNCDRLQIRIPLENQTMLTGSLSSYRINDVRNTWERRIAGKKPIQGPIQPASQTSSLFSLPTELRLQIYAHILPEMDKVTHILPLNRDSARVITHMGYSKTGPRDLTKTNLLSTCHAVYYEALDLLFTNTTYRFENTKLLYLFLRHIGTHGRSLLKSIDIQCGHREDAVAFALLATCSRLRSITIRLARPVLLTPLPRPWMLDGVACLLELSGLETVGFASCRVPGMTYLDENKPDAIFLRNKLMRPRGEGSGMRWVNGHLDL